MPNIKSAIKRVKVNEKKKELNKAFKSKLATYIKKFKASTEAKDSATAEKFFAEVTSLLDNGARENIIHKNSAARKKSSLAKRLNSLKAVETKAAE